MHGASIIRYALCLVLVLSASAQTSAIAAEKAIISGTPTANLRVGPSTEQPIIVTLKEGDVVTVEKLEGDWYQVTAVEGQKGYIHKNLLKLESAQKPAAPAAKAPAGEPQNSPKTASPAAAPSASAPGEAPKPAPPSPPTAALPPPAKAPAPPAAAAPAAAKSTALIHLIEGREFETVICFGIAILAFLLGWICGGIYALRRDRHKRRRLVF
jgi:hypothetical protein